MIDGSLFRVIGNAALSNYIYLDLTRILHLIFDLSCNISRKQNHVCIADRLCCTGG